MLLFIEITYQQNFIRIEIRMQKSIYFEETFYQHVAFKLIFNSYIPAKTHCIFLYILRFLLVRSIKVHHFRHFLARLFLFFFFFFLNEFFVPRHRTSGYTPRMQQRLRILVERGNRNFFSKCVPRRVFKWHALPTGRGGGEIPSGLTQGIQAHREKSRCTRARFPMEIQSPEHQLGNSSPAQSFCLLNRHSWDARINPFATPRCHSTVIFIPDYKQCLKFMLA